MMAERILKRHADSVSTFFERLVPECNDLRGPMVKAMRYSFLGGGKRIRPALVMEFCAACGGNENNALPAAAAIEMIHTYSLIHDDLPCMDNDDLRRGRPTAHIAFDEATALLAGDGLLTLAFETVLDSDHFAAKQAARTLSRAAGICGMVGGQAMDMALEHRKDVDIVVLRDMHKGKTGALISAACEMGCLFAGAGDEVIAAARVYSENIGLAFQIKDDILDVIGNANTLGKPIGSDRKSDKTTFVTLFSIEEAEQYANELTEKAIKALDVFKNRENLMSISKFFLNRSY